MTSEFRIEHDTMGEVRVPVDALYRAQTQRAVENFPISGNRLERSHIEALARIKKAAARANAELGVLEQDVADAIVAAADEVAGGAHDVDFPIDVYQTGSGTSSNMNTNEVLATLATPPPRPRGAPERPRQRVAVVQRRVPHRRCTSPRPPASSATWSPRSRTSRSPWRRSRVEWAPRGQVGPHAPHGRHARDPRAGVRWVRGGGPLRHRAPGVGAPPRRRGPARRHGRGHGHQHARGLPAARHRAAPRGHRPAADRGARPLRGAERPRRARRAVGCAAHDRGQPHEDLQRPALDGVGPEHRARRDRHPGPAARVVDHAGQGQPGDPRGRPHGRRARDRQRRHGRVGRCAAGPSS